MCVDSRADMLYYRNYYLDRILAYAEDGQPYTGVGPEWEETGMKKEDYEALCRLPAEQREAFLVEKRYRKE